MNNQQLQLPNNMMQAAQQQAAVEAGCQQFIAETAQKIYATRIAHFADTRSSGPFTKEEHELLNKMAQEAMQLAPYLAQAAGLPVKVNFTGKE